MSQEVNELITRIYRGEFVKMVGVLTNFFGFSNISAAEDIVQDTLTEAVDNWTQKGIPENPSAWMYKVAKNKAFNIIRRESYNRQFVEESQYVSNQLDLKNEISDIIFTDKIIVDDQLRMIFACSHPSISIDSQVALILRTLCGFTIPEIASAFLSSEETINKRLVRARKKIRDSGVALEFPSDKEQNVRLNAVLKSLYLLFNEGYKASNGDDVVRSSLCLEVIRLTQLFLDHNDFRKNHYVHSLLALMLFNSSRFASRTDNSGNPIKLEDQNRDLWDYSIIKDGFISLECAQESGFTSKYHQLALISAYHCSAKNFESTNWLKIVECYDQLMEIDSSPTLRFNRAIALFRRSGVAIALEELQSIESEPEMQSSYLYFAFLSEIQRDLGDTQKALEAIDQAIELTSVTAEKTILNQRKIELQKNNFK